MRIFLLKMKCALVSLLVMDVATGATTRTSSVGGDTMQSVLAMCFVKLMMALWMLVIFGL